MIDSIVSEKQVRDAFRAVQEPEVHHPHYTRLPLEGQDQGRERAGDQETLSRRVAAGDEGRHAVTVAEPRASVPAFRELARSVAAAISVLQFQVYF